MLSDKFIKKYMRLAKLVGEDQNPCYSRQIGTVIVDPELNSIISTGYNGPPRGTPHCDSRIFLLDMIWPRLSEEQKSNLKIENSLEFVNKYADSGQCPRKILGFKSGEATDWCSCCHSEANAIQRATSDLTDCALFCYCLLPCIECAKSIIQAGISHIFCLKEEKDYSYGSRWLLGRANIEINELEKDWILN